MSLVHQMLKTINITHYDYQAKTNYIYGTNGLQTERDRNVISLTLHQVQKASNQKLTLSEAHQWVADQFNLVKQLSNGKINMWHLGFIQPTLRAILGLNGYETRIKYQSEPIGYEEFQWTENAIRGAYNYHTKGTYDNVIYYDQKSSYPSILYDDSFKIPVKQGIWKTLTQQEMDAKKYFPYGIYQCQIVGEHIFFKENQKGYYTHIDLELARKLGLRIQIKPTTPNALIYASIDKYCLANSHEVFGQQIEWLYDLKQKYGKRCPLFKSLITQMYTSVCKTKKTDFWNSVPDGYEAVKIKPFSATQRKYTCVPTHDCCVTHLGRLKPFIYARQRYMMWQKVLSQPFWKDIVAFITDGFWVTRPIPQFDRNPPLIGNICRDKECKQIEVITGNNIKKIEFELPLNHINN